ncbi:hypothetical protein GXW74_23220 [Roseomonas eburnea]|uniref:Uncharacterized protein n=1 Tax=Neoroseomonas eburnea TaxID=1346889 RepID=A0A9X9XI80_9PROT|nr:hypothetical protein [Neoroseomonas eburnea]MBR0683416.1 hypothetical protein [Neoroseomonas eburnea]
MPSDARIPVTILADSDNLAAWLGAGGPAALLTDAPQLGPGFVATERLAPRPAHRFGCACCAGRSAAAMALDRLFQGRARNRTGWFDRVAVVAVSATAREEVAAALREDALALARFRPG